MFARKLNISEENFQRLNSNIKLNFKNGSTFKPGTGIVVPVQDEEASLAVMANSIMCKEATQKRNLRVISNRRVNEASGVPPGCYSPAA